MQYRDSEIGFSPFFQLTAELIQTLNKEKIEKIQFMVCLVDNKKVKIKTDYAETVTLCAESPNAEATDRKRMRKEFWSNEHGSEVFCFANMPIVSYK